MKKLGRIISGFFRALWEDFVNGLKRHWLRYLGLLVIYIVPLIVLIVQNIQHQTDRAYLPVWLYPVLAIMIIMYFTRIRKKINVGLTTEIIADRLGVARNAGKRIGYEILDKGMLVASIALFYAFVRVINEMGTKIEHAFLFLLITTSVGSLLCLFDTIKNIGLDYSESEGTEQ